jgi:iron complex outermembrane receptor protein
MRCDIAGRLAVLCAGVWLAAAPLHAQAPDLRQATIEELMELTVTSAARKGQRAEDVAAAIYVITRQQIRTSGLRSLPEILRLAPGVQVARAGSGKWAVSIRGFNDVFSNKLLILIDGRSVYNRSFSGVFWESLDLPLEDIERIEVIRGPGGVIWGANAVNGVLNIITTSAEASLGGAVSLSAGSLDEGRASLRYGARAGPLAYRVFARASTHGETLSATDAGSEDDWTSFSSGFRADWSAGRDVFMAQAQGTAGHLHPRWIEMVDLGAGLFRPSGRASETLDLHALARWTRTLSAATSLQVQGSVSRTRRDEATAYLNERSSDLDAQVVTGIGARHTLVAGGGYRHISFDARGTPTLEIASERAHVVNVFASDEIVLHPRVRATVGARLEHDSAAGFGFVPSAGVIWSPSENQRLWASLSRARRTPSLVERTLRYYIDAVQTPGGPVIVGFLGNPDFQPETLTQASAGYRVHAGASASLDLVGFYGRYEDLATIEPRAPELRLSPAPAHVLAAARYENLMDAVTRGVEASGEWAPRPALRLSGAIAFLDLSPRIDAASLDADASEFDGDAPAMQWQAHASLWATPRLRLDAGLWRVGALRRMGVPAYTRADLQAERRLTDRVSLFLSGQNLFDRSHLELTGVTVVPSYVPRSWTARLRWNF